MLKQKGSESRDTMREVARVSRIEIRKRVFIQTFDKIIKFLFQLLDTKSQSVITHRKTTQNA